MDQTRLGKYRHYKNHQLYEVLGLARHSETNEELVVYKLLYGDYSLWVRPERMFFEIVDHEGKPVPRFIKID